MSRFVTLMVGALPLLSTGLVSAQGLHAVDSIGVVDSKGSRVGTVIGMTSVDINSSRAVLAFDFGGKVVILRASRGGLEGTVDNPLFFDAPSCSGQAFMEQPTVAGTPPELALVQVSWPGNTVYLADPASQSNPQRVQVRSHFDQRKNGTGECRDDGDSTFEDGMMPVSPIVDLDQLFTPPLRLVTGALPLNSCCGDCNGNAVVTIDEIITAVNHSLMGCPAH